MVKSNASFNAFVVPSDPELADRLVQVSMTRQLDLSDDMKEYWGFYFLQGSTVTVSACVRFLYKSYFQLLPPLHFLLGP